MNPFLLSLCEFPLTAGQKLGDAILNQNLSGWGVVDSDNLPYAQRRIVHGPSPHWNTLKGSRILTQIILASKTSSTKEATIIINIIIIIIIIIIIMLKLRCG